MVALHTDLTTMHLTSSVDTLAADALMFLANSAPAIGYATSTDGSSWAKVAAPVMTDTTGWVNLGVMTPAVIKTSTGYVMYYSGASVTLGLVDSLKAATSVAGLETALLANSKLAIGRATSIDGITGWIKDANPILEKGAIGEWDNYGVFAPTVIKNADGTWDMWYTGLKGSLSSGFSYLGNQSATLNNMFLTGFNSAIGHATSADGIAWTKETGANPVLSKGAGFAWDNYGVAFPAALVNQGYLVMWYTGVTADPDAALSSYFNGDSINTIMVAGTGTSSKIGYANYSLPSSGIVDVSGDVDQNGKFTREMVITADEGEVSVNIPAGTVALDGNDQPLTEISIQQIATPPLNAAGFKFLGAFFEIGPTGATFNPAITITISYAEVSLPAGTSEDVIQIGYVDKNGVFNSLPTTIHKDTKTATAETTHFTPYGLLIPDGTPAKITTSNLTISSPQIPVNGKATASVVVTDSGGSTGTYVVDLKINGTVVESKSVTLSPGESQTVTFDITGDQVGSYSIAIDNASATLTVHPAETTSTPLAKKTNSLPIVIGIIIGVLLGGVLVFLVVAQVRKPSTFAVSDIVINPQVIKPGETATITVKVTNTSGKPGIYKAVMFVNNNAESSRDVNIDKGASELVSFSISKNTPAIYVINVENVRGELIVNE